MLGNKKVVSIVATKSGMGKTTIIEKLIKIFNQKGYKTGVIKHDAHKFEIDKKGKDSYRFSEAGANDVILASSEKIALIRKLEKDIDIDSLINIMTKVDIIFIEGFKNSIYPKIEIHRKNHDTKFLFNDNNFNKDTFLAIATDEKVEGIKNLDINNINEIAQFIEDYNFTKYY